MYDNDQESDWPVIDPSSLEVRMEDKVVIVDPFDIDAGLPQQQAKDKSKVWNYFEKQVPSFEPFLCFGIDCLDFL